MEIFEIALSRCARVALFLFLALTAGLLLLGQPPWPVRLLLASLVLLPVAALGTARRTRLVRNIRFRGRSAADVILENGRTLGVSRISLGLVRPWLILADVRVEGGRQLSLVACRDSLDRQAHWRLRREILRFRVAGPDDEGMPAARAGTRNPDTQDSRLTGM